MKVCMWSSVHPCFDVRIFQKEARSLAEAGYQVTVIAIADFKEKVVDQVRVLGLPQPEIRALRPLSWYRILRIALREKADLYHFHDPELLLVGSLVKVLTKRPIIYDVHENYPQDILTKEWIPGVLRKAISKVFKVFEDTMVKFVDGVVVVNRLLAERFNGKSRVVTISNYSRLEQFVGKEPESEQEDKRLKPYFVYAGRISDDRGIPECIEALKSLNDENIELICAGRIGHVSNQELRKVLDGSQSSTFFQYLGLLPFAHIPPLLRGALAGLLCFQATPNNLLGTPNKLFEYMSAGIPVIASDFPFIREVVLGADCGLLVQPDDIEEIATAMTNLLHSPGDARRMGENGVRAARERYNWRAQERKLLSLYQALLGSESVAGHTDIA
jgi:glycosyltransferase involved in cell wall biosynthesis